MAQSLPPPNTNNLPKIGTSTMTRVVQSVSPEQWVHSTNNSNGEINIEESIKKYLAILALRTTPQKNGMPSPATCLMNRNLRTTLPLFSVNKKRGKPKKSKTFSAEAKTINMQKNINHFNPVQQ